MMRKPALPKLRKFPASKQRRLDQLLERNSDGTISARDKETLKKLVAEAEELMVANAKRLLEFSEAESLRKPTGAVPVTVWIHPQSQQMEPERGSR